MKKILFVALVFVLLSLTACSGKGILATPAATEAPTEVVTETGCDTICPTPTPSATVPAVNTPEPTQTVVPTATATATETPASVSSSIAMVEFPNCAKNAVEIISPDPTIRSMNQYYFLDDRGAGRVANDADITGASNVTAVVRWWQAVNADTKGSKNIPWTHLLSGMQSSTTDLGFALIEPTKYQVTIPVDGATFKFTILRDMNAVTQLQARGDVVDPDPYTMAIQGDLTQKTQEQLSWYISGNGYLLTTLGWIDLSKYSAVEVAFPRELKQGLEITVVNNQGGMVYLWQGSSENCYMPADQLHKDVPLINVNTVDIWQ